MAAALFGALWLVPGALLPLLVGNAVDHGIAGGDGRALMLLAGAVIVVGLVQAVCAGTLEFFEHGMWIHASSTTQRAVSEHTARLGASLRPQVDTGEVMAIPSSDIDEIGTAFEAFGRTVGSVVAFLTVAIFLLSSSPLLGAVALVGVPLAVAGIGPLLAPLRRNQEKRREQLSEINSLGSDIVSGLRILRGIGGERQFLRRFRAASQRVRHAGVRVARSDSWLEAAEVLLPGIVTVVITWLGAHLALAGTITVGELIAFYGAAAFLVIPVSAATEAADALSSALVSAKKVSGVLALRQLLAEPASPVPLPAGALSLFDSVSGIAAAAGKLTVVDLGADQQHQPETVAARLARFPTHLPCPPHLPAGHQVLVAGVPAEQVALAELRRRVVYAHNQDIWFSGILRDEVAPDHETGVDVMVALAAADAEDIVLALPNGLDELIGERGREVSGGQRQRLSLARALALDADVLLLDEPTSAVDAHTEARITERVAALRRGKTTVVFSQSPLWHAVADERVTR